MSDIFISQPGSVAILTEVSGLPGSVSIRSQNGALLTDDRVIITGVAYSKSAHTQFQQTMDQDIYLYSFGEKIGMTTISGLSFSKLCAPSSSIYDPSGPWEISGPASPASYSDGLSGIEVVMQMYRENRLTRATNWVPIFIWIGATNAIEGWVLGVDVQSASASNMTYQWSLKLATLPDQD